LACVVTAAALGLRQAFSGYFGTGLTYITFYPAVMLTALLGGLGPGLLATLLSAWLAVWLILPPQGQFLLVTAADFVGLTLFSAMGIFMSVVAGLYRHAQQAERESQQNFRTLADSMPQLVWSARPDGTVDYYNARRQEFTGFSQAPDGTWKWDPVLHPDDLQPTAGAWERAVRTGTLYQIEHRVQRADGSFSWVLSRGTPIRDGDGRIVKWYGTATDIDDLKRGEAERERLLAELDATIDAMGNAVILYGLRGEIRRMNPAAEMMFRYSEAMKSRPLLERTATLRPETVDGRPYPMAEHPALKALAGETVLSKIMAYHTAGSASPIWVSVSAAPIRSADWKILGAVSVMTDVTLLRELQQEREMTIHTISHDLRTPLTVVLGHAELLGEFCREEGCEQHVQAIALGAERMEAMIEDLVEAARLEGGEIALAKEAVRLDRFITDLLERTAAALATSRIFLSVPPQLPAVAADPNRLERILTNLLTNALKYSPPESPVDLRAHEAGKEIVIAVKDRGQGIHPGDLAHIFDRFYRPRDGRKAGSVGLGLFITRSLVEAHGGRVWVESEPGVGSPFFFTLPKAGV
jgi:PAS domain S-box-containing protein